MVKHTIEVSNTTQYVATTNNQIVFSSDGKTIGQVAGEDVGVLVIDSPSTTFTHAALLKITACGGAIVICDEKHLPSAIMLPFSKHVEVIWRIDDQLSVTRPIAKRIWQQTVSHKIIAQAANLECAPSPQSKLLDMSKHVKSGDSTNKEAHAARVYWQHWLADTPFKRDTNGHGVNALLNYGYAIIRAAVAREIVAAGLSPAIGIHHQNRSNHFCLADDLMEPMRPFVDYCVRQLVYDGYSQICKHVKQSLLELLGTTVQFKNEHGPLSVQIKKTVQSYVNCLKKVSKKIDFPILCS